MPFIAQTWALIVKNLLIIFVRRWFSTTLRALILPVAFVWFLSYAKNLFLPPSYYGIGTPVPVRSFANSLASSSSSRTNVVFINNGHTGGDIEKIIQQLSQVVTAAGKQAHTVGNSDGLLRLCPSSLNGVSPCYGAVSFHSSPSEGSAGQWNYTMYADGALGASIYVNREDNDVEVYALPFQHAIDSAINAVTSGSSLPTNIEQYPFTDQTEHERQRSLQRLLALAMQNYLAVAFLIGIIGVTYQLVGHIAVERELGMSQLIEAMMPNKRQWQPQAARLLSYHIAFSIIYLPGWIIIGLLLAYFVFPSSSVALILFFHILFGFSLTSYSILWGVFFRRAQLSGIITTIVAVVLGIIAQQGIGKFGSNVAILITSFLLPPMNYIFSLIYMGKFEYYGQPVNLLQAGPGDFGGFANTAPGIWYWIFMIIQIPGLPLLAACVEQWLFATRTKNRQMKYDQDNSVAVRLESFTKTYRSGWLSSLFCCGSRRKREIFTAVDTLTLDVPKGQILVLLGANGSGKSTTLEAIAGVNSISSGTIEIDGKGGLGLCPQKNVMWDDLTVHEHVRIFSRLKQTDTKASGEDLHQLVTACDLDRKLHARAKTLSGGQKRKLQLSMMLTGGSTICLVDEASSGIDPLARRKVWDILLAERGTRTIILCTHFLDEADVLSDQIAILSKGTLKAEGTSVELKAKLGGGYRVHVKSNIDLRRIDGQEFIPKSSYYDETVFHLPDSRQTSDFISRLEASGIQEYRVNGPTVQDVFLKLAEELQGEFGEPKVRTTELPSSVPDADFKNGAHFTHVDSNSELDLHQGSGTGSLKQTWILFRKRISVLRHNYMPYFAALIVPIVDAGLVTLWVKSRTPLGCTPSEQYSVANIDYAQFYAPSVYGPPSKIPATKLRQQSETFVDTLFQFNQYIRNNYGDTGLGAFVPASSKSAPIFTYDGKFGLPFAVQAQSLLDNMIGNTSIRTTYQDFAVPYVPTAGSTLLLVFYVLLAMSVYPAFFGLYPTAERLRKVRALHYSNGIKGLPLWASYAIFDFLFVLFASVIAIALFTSQWDHWYYPGYLFLIFVLFGLASIAYSYVISLFVSSQLAAFAFSAGSQAVLFLLYFVAYLCIRTYLPAQSVNYYVNVAHFTIAAITPAGNLVRALLLSLNNFSLLCDGHSVSSSPAAMINFGGPILYLILQFLLTFAFVVWYDGGGRIRFIMRRVDKLRLRDVEDTDEKEIAATEDLQRVQTGNDELRVLNLSKKFGSNLAVDRVTFGIKKGEIFGLLGPNGAGKSTTISLIRGDLRPTGDGDVVVEGISLAKHRHHARNHLGVCPQFDAIDQLSTADHLRFYARIRGVQDVQHNVERVMAAIGLTPYKNRKAAKLSGGNRRKLSLAIAIIGNPSVLLLDEPSSGMDAAAKRVMWRVLGTVTKNRALLITTHSMEECEALADRVGIMAGRMLALGSTDELRRQHGDAYQVHLVHKDAPHTSTAEMDCIKNWVELHIPGAITEERTFHGQLRFSVPNRHEGDAINSTTSRSATPPSAGEKPIAPEIEPVSPLGDATPDTTRSQGLEKSQRISALFALLEAHREDLGFAYYSVSPTTLDEVFLNVVNKHNVQEENYALMHSNPKGRSWRGLWRRK